MKKKKKKKNSKERSKKVEKALVIAKPQGNEEIIKKLTICKEQLENYITKNMNG